MFPRPKMVTLMGKLFSPKDLPGLVLWLRADDIAGADGAAVAAWNDRSGNGNNFAQAVGGSQPVLKKASNGIGGRNTVLFDGSADHLLAGVIDSSSQGIVFAVLRMTAAIKDFQVLFSTCDEASATRYTRCYTYTDAATKVMYIAQRDNDVADVVIGSSIILAATNYIFVWQSTGAAYNLRENGTGETEVVSGGANNGDWFGDTSARDNFAIGGIKDVAGPGAYFKGSLAELLYYNTVPSAAQITQLENYLAARYSITLNP